MSDSPSELTKVTSNVKRAIEQIQSADTLIITAGAGFGVDSGLPDFRGKEGFWKAYPALGEAGLDFSSVATPNFFAEHPHKAWGFYGHRLNLYRNTKPHEGFQILREVVNQKTGSSYVVTSNVDGHFQKAGFDPKRVFECHGSIHHLQCTDSRCPSGIWLANNLEIEVDEKRCIAQSPLPKCPYCRNLARPNIVLFDDYGWNPSSYAKQERQFATWVALQRKTKNKVLVLELGAGHSVMTVRLIGEGLGYPIVRVNPGEEPYLPSSTVTHVRMGALSFLTKLRDSGALR